MHTANQFLTIYVDIHRVTFALICAANVVQSVTVAFTVLILVNHPVLGLQG